MHKPAETRRDFGVSIELVDRYCITMKRLLVLLVALFSVTSKRMCGYLFIVYIYVRPLLLDINQNVYFVPNPSQVK